MTAAKEELLALQVTAVSALKCSGRPGGEYATAAGARGRGEGKRRRNDGCVSVFEGVGLVECLFVLLSK